MDNNLTQANIWIDIKKRIEFAIINGTFTNASKMPSIKELSEKYGCGRSTAHKVLEELYNDGIVTKQKGVGYFVKPFVREKLKKKYMDVWELQLEINIKEALLLDISADILKKIICDKITHLCTHGE